MSVGKSSISRLKPNGSTSGKTIPAAEKKAAVKTTAAKDAAEKTTAKKKTASAAGKTSAAKVTTPKSALPQEDATRQAARAAETAFRDSSTIRATSCGEELPYWLL